jgi:hypothetical protein
MHLQIQLKIPLITHYRFPLIRIPRVRHARGNNTLLTYNIYIGITC